MQSHKQVKVLGSRMSYVDVGEGPVVLFQHGNPTQEDHADIIGRRIADWLITSVERERPSTEHRTR